MIVHTAPLFYRGPDRIDIAPMTTCEVGRVIGPMFGETRPAYSARIFGLNRDRGRVFSGLLALDSVTLCCSCDDGAECHRTTLALCLVRLGAISGGERHRVPLAAYTCGVRFCGGAIDTGQALCSAHWGQLPFDLQRELLATHTEGQRYTGLMSRGWMAAMGRALDLLAECADGTPAYLATDGAGVPGYLRDTRIAQDKAWRAQMAPRKMRSAGAEFYADAWREAVGDRWDAPEPEPAAPVVVEAPVVVQAPAPVVAKAPPPAPTPKAPAKVKAPAKPRGKRGGWRFEGPTLFGGDDE